MKSPLKVTLSALVLAAAVGGVSTAAQAANPVVCAAYAQGAVFQQNKNLNMSCGYSGIRWSNNYAGHYAWCLAAPIGAVQFEGNARKNLLQQCSGGGSQTKTFFAPKYGGLRLDWCYAWATQCGAFAAKAYCVSKGYPMAKSWAKANNIGNFTDTRVFSNGQVCSGPDCDGFTSITCKK